MPIPLIRYTAPIPTDRAAYLRALGAMTPEQRLNTAMELGELSRSLCRAGLRQRHPAADEATLQSLYLKILDRCHNRNY